MAKMVDALDLKFNVQEWAYEFESRWRYLNNILLFKQIVFNLEVGDNSNPLMAELADAVDSKSAELGSYKFESC